MGFTKKTKIVCTMGPSTEDEEVLRQLILHGMNVARFNFSHGSHEYHRQMIEKVRNISKELGIPVAILLDTKGPEVRTGLLEDGKKVTVKDGRFGPYVTDGETNVTVPRAETVEDLTAERAYELLADKRAKGPAPKRTRKTAAKKTTAKKTTTKKTTAKKTATQKAATKKDS